jgi:alanine-glyoxylate transaminase/serine-glyoxylate transaminase/serine-pyruvate transaminase
MSYQPGRHFLQLPGPTNCPIAVLQALAMPTIDHRGPEFGLLGRQVLADIKTVFKTSEPVIIYTASGTGAWEAALANTLSPGDRVLMFETGHFATLWQKIAGQLGLKADFIHGDWRSGVNADGIGARLAEDKTRQIKAVAVVHNETSTGVLSDIAAVRKAIDAAHHPALLLVDTVSSLGAADYRHDEWGVDVTVSGSQKGLMLPPGLSFNAISAKALAAAQSARLPRSYWDWEDMISFNKTGYFPYTPNTNLLQALRVALGLLQAEGLDNVFRRHQRAAEATRRCVLHWGLELQCRVAAEYSPVLTGVQMPKGFSADRLRADILAQSNMSLGAGLGRLADKIFRIGHVGDFHDMIATAALTGVEMGLKRGGVPHRPGGVDVAMTYLAAANPVVDARKPATADPRATMSAV